MTWFSEDKRTWSQKLFGEILKSGPLPKHVAIIMDGNRRYAKSRNIKKIEGHISGFEKLVEALNWCFCMDIKEVSVYAFSIENFKRSPDEVNALFDLAREKFQRLLDEKEKLDEMGVCVRIFGDLTLLPPDLRQILAKVINTTRHHKSLFMNVCLAYTSREEMTMSIKDICSGVKNKKIEISDINEDLIDKCLYTSNSLDLDLLVRTSGEVRLSDFLLWQSNISAIAFIKRMWPEFSVWNFYMGILHYQLNYEYITKIKASVNQLKRKDLEITCKMSVIENRQQLVEKIKKSTDVVSANGENLQALAKHVATEAVEKCANEHETRVETFLGELYAERCKKVEIIETKA
jgi:ditrans,polycis-polyprenyl diphosphate synthase